jgi:hypothetical protein
MRLTKLLPRVVLRFCGAECPDERASAYHEMRHIAHSLDGTEPSEGTKDTERLVSRARKKQKGGI